MNLLTWLQAHGVATLIIVFTIASLALDFVASIFKALGDAVPGWIGTALGVVGTILHFLNGNTAAASGSTPASS